MASYSIQSLTPNYDRRADLQEELYIFLALPDTFQFKNYDNMYIVIKLLRL